MLSKCPCGETPKELNISQSYMGSKYAQVSGMCCGEWEIEFRTNYHNVECDACMELAIRAWNEAKRG